MFSLQPTDELVFGTPTKSELILDDDYLIVDRRSSSESNIINFSNSKQLSQTTKVVVSPQGQTVSRDDCNITRAAMHRDIERRRRQETSDLFGSLRSLLPPLEHIKGRRSMCNHIEEATDYIKHMQKNIEELRIRRDKLKKICKLSGKQVSTSNSTVSQDFPNRVTVNVVFDGLEILIASSSELGLSRALTELLERELNVVSCVSTKAKGSFLHKIQAETLDVTSLDLPELQWRLTNAIS